MTNTHLVVESCIYNGVIMLYQKEKPILELFIFPLNFIKKISKKINLNLLVDITASTFIHKTLCLVDAEVWRVHHFLLHAKVTRSLEPYHLHVFGKTP